MFDKANNRNIKMTTKYENKANNKKKDGKFFKKKIWQHDKQEPRGIKI